MNREYEETEQLQTKIAQLRSKVAELEASERERERTREAVRKIEEHFQFNGVARTGIPSFFWFPRF